MLNRTQEKVQTRMHSKAPHHKGEYSLHLDKPKKKLGGKRKLPENLCW